MVDTIPLAIPGLPFGFILGLAVVEAPIDNIVGWFGAWFIMGGAAQLTMISLMTDGAAVTAAVAAALIVNARHFMYSMAIAGRFQDQPTWFRLIGPHFLVDQVFALNDLRPPVSPTNFRHYYLASGLTMLGPWTVWVALGITVGARIPDSWNLGFAVPVMFLGLLMLGLKNAAAVTAATVGFAVTVIASGLPNRTGLLLGAAAGILAASLVPAERSSPEEAL